MRGRELVVFLVRKDRDQSQIVGITHLQEHSDSQHPPSSAFHHLHISGILRCLVGDLGRGARLVAEGVGLQHNDVGDVSSSATPVTIRCRLT